jgi:hypothetical protein
MGIINLIPTSVRSAGRPASSSSPGSSGFDPRQPLVPSQSRHQTSLKQPLSLRYPFLWKRLVDGKKRVGQLPAGLLAGGRIEFRIICSSAVLKPEQRRRRLSPPYFATPSQANFTASANRLSSCPTTQTHLLLAFSNPQSHRVVQPFGKTPGRRGGIGSVQGIEVGTKHQKGRREHMGPKDGKSAQKRNWQQRNSTQ